MAKINNTIEIGKVYGNLTVIDSIYLPQVKGNTFHWVCKCGCGETVNVRNSILYSRVGCHKCSIIYKRRLKEERFEQKHHAIKRRTYLSYIKRAKQDNISFNLTFEKAIKLFSENCFYCGQEPTVPRGYCKGNSLDGEFKRNTIDRLDSLKGYSEDNVVSCCLKCNKAKLDNSVGDFLEWVDRVYHYQRVKSSSTIPRGSTSQANGGGNSFPPEKEDDIVNSV